MKKLLLCLTSVIFFSLLNVATADSITECDKLIDASKYREALPFCLEACNQNDGLGCFALGMLYDKGQDVKQDYQQAKIYYEKSCNLNDGLGCAGIGLLYASGRGVRQNFQTAKEYFDKACDLGEQVGCDAYRELNEL